MNKNRCVMIVSLLCCLASVARSENGDGTNITFSHQMIEVAKSDWKNWFEKEPSHYRGDYYGENGAGETSIQLWAYYDDKLHAIRFAGCVLVTLDAFTEAKVTPFRNLEYSTQSKTITNGAISFRPVEIKTSSGEWIKGVVYNSVFCEIKK